MPMVLFDALFEKIEQKLLISEVETTSMFQIWLKLSFFPWFCKDAKSLFFFENFAKIKIALQKIRYQMKQLTLNIIKKTASQYLNRY